MTLDRVCKPFKIGNTRAPMKVHNYQNQKEHELPAETEVFAITRAFKQTLFATNPDAGDDELFTVTDKELYHALDKYRQNRIEEKSDNNGAGAPRSTP